MKRPWVTWSNVRRFRFLRMVMICAWTLVIGVLAAVAGNPHHAAAASVTVLSMWVLASASYLLAVYWWEQARCTCKIDPGTGSCPSCASTDRVPW